LGVQRLSALDASFLRVESATAHMHIGWLSWLRLPEGQRRLDAALLAATIASRLHLAPRFRQRIQPLAVGEPAWADAPDFRLEHHMEVAGSGPLNRREARELADEFLSTPLHRSDPLWRLLAIEQVEGGRAAVVGKVHHCMVDGIAAVELGTLLFDLVPDSAPVEPRDWSPQPVATGVRLTTQAVADEAVEQLRTTGRALRLGLSPRRSARLAETMRRAAFSAVGDAIRPAPASYLNAPITARRTLVAASVPIARLRAIKGQLGATINDVVLATVTSALRRFATSVDEQPEALRAMVPVSVRGDEEVGGNRITFAFVDLPCDEPDPMRRLSSIRAQMADLKASGQIAGSDAMLQSTKALPGFLKERAARLAASPRVYNLTVSNVPGPRSTLYLAGAEVESIYPVIPTPDRHALAVGVLSYRDRMHFAAHANPDVLPSASELGSLIRAGVNEIERRLSARPGPRAAPARLRPSTRPRRAGEAAR
jgi:diacylglycerol O-acyltransferase / wax synthase